VIFEKIESTSIIVERINSLAFVKQLFQLILGHGFRLQMVHTAFYAFLSNLVVNFC